MLPQLPHLFAPANTDSCVWWARGQDRGIASGKWTWVNAQAGECFSLTHFRRNNIFDISISPFRTHFSNLQQLLLGNSSHLHILIKIFNSKLKEYNWKGIQILLTIDFFVFVQGYTYCPVTEINFWENAILKKMIMHTLSLFQLIEKKTPYVHFN